MVKSAGASHVVITGSSRGIGLELVRQALARQDYVLAVARTPERSKGLMDLKAKYGERLQVVAVELKDPEAPAKVAAAVADWPAVDILINNAGIYLSETTTEAFLESFHVNSIVPFHLTQALVPALKRSRSARAIQMTSLMGSIQDNHGGGGYYAYRASKAALNMINKNLSLEHKWLTSIAMHPGWVQTDMGGAGAPTPVTESAEGVWKVIAGLKLTDSGAFFNFRGELLPW